MTRARDLANLIGSGNFTTETLTATAGQTAFTPSNTFTSNFLQVFYNGLLLDPAVDYTENGTTITLTVAATAGDEMEVVTYNTFSVGDAITQTEADVRYVNASGDTVSGALAVTGDLTVDTNTLYVDSTNNRVGVGTASPASELDVVGTVSATGGYVETGIDSTSTNAVFTAYRAGNGVQTGNFVRLRSAGDGAGNANQLIFDTNSSEAMRIDSSGNLLVGKTTATGTAKLDVEGGIYNSINTASSGSQFHQRNGSGNGSALMVSRTASDGILVDFQRGQTRMGIIRSVNSGADMMIGTGNSGLQFYNSQLSVIPARPDLGQAVDNYLDIGHISFRWDDVYATNGTIQTSDANEKQDIAELDEAEKRVAVAAKGLIRKYRWKDAVAEKGDDARIHVGIIAQDLQAAFAAEGLDAGRYAMFISSTWWEHEGQTYETAEEAPEGATERTRLGVRYPELLAFIIGAM